MNKKVIGTICGVVIVSSVLSISKCDYFNNKHKEINIITTTSVKNNYFVIPDSSTRYLTEDDLMGLTSDELEIARNEIYARHGYIFKQKKMINYFSNQRWYVKSKNKVTTDDLSEIEYDNVMLIKKVENEGFSNDDQDYSNVDFIIPDSSYRKVTSKELKSLSSYELAVARNEIYARHGYIFVSNEWKDFFVGRYWYTPTSKDVTLNSVEEYNVSMILKEEATR